MSLNIIQIIEKTLLKMTRGFHVVTEAQPSEKRANYQAQQPIGFLYSHLIYQRQANYLLSCFKLNTFSNASHVVDNR